MINNLIIILEVLFFTLIIYLLGSTVMITVFGSICIAAFVILEKDFIFSQAKETLNRQFSCEPV